MEKTQVQMQVAFSPLQTQVQSLLGACTYKDNCHNILSSVSIPINSYYFLILFYFAQYLTGHDTVCYKTITFGRVAQALDAAAMWVRSLVYVIHIL